jgi:hypothetical protein
MELGGWCKPPICAINLQKICGRRFAIDWKTRFKGCGSVHFEKQGVLQLALQLNF